ncbi:hypothetical protein HYW82_00130 [Candidatus Peregrinibacteria bacterium]|nr:hypothetical protein [Candidatus Peregrinibacteria bacterium]
MLSMREPDIFNFRGNLQVLRHARTKRETIEGQFAGLPNSQTGKREKLNGKIATQRARERRAVLKLLAGGITVAGGVAVAGAVGTMVLSSDKQPEADTPETVSPKLPFGIDATENNYLTEEHARALYDQAFDLVMADVPDDFYIEDPASKDYPISALSMIKNFRQQHVKWATIHGKQYVAIEPGNSGGGWMSIVTPDNESFAGLPQALSIDSQAGVIVLRIKAFPCTKEWAGIFLVHELVHLYDRVAGLEAYNPSREEFLLGEVRSFTFETEIADRLSKGAYRTALDRLISDLKFQNPDQCIEAAGRNPDFMERIHARLDNIITGENSKSPEEEAMRDAFYLISLGFRIIETNPQLSSDYREFVRFYEKVHAGFAGQ